MEGPLYSEVQNLSIVVRTTWSEIFSFRGQQNMLAVFDAEASGMASDSVSDGGMLLSCSFIAFPTNGLCS